jgi:uncharacterized lipoprotein
MKKILKQVLLISAVLAVLVLAGCDDNKGPMQTAGEKADNAASATGSAVKGAAETTGDAVKNAADATGDFVEGAADKTGEAAENVTN